MKKKEIDAGNERRLANENKKVKIKYCPNIVGERKNPYDMRRYQKDVSDTFDLSDMIEL